MEYVDAVFMPAVFFSVVSCLGRNAGRGRQGGCQKQIPTASDALCISLWRSMSRRWPSTVI